MGLTLRDLVKRLSVRWIFCAAGATCIVLWALSTFEVIAPRPVLWMGVVAIPALVILTLRAAHAAMEDSGSLAAGIGGYGLAIVLAAMGAGAWANVVSAKWHPPQALPAQMGLTLQGDTIGLKGEITLSHYYSMVKMLEQTAQQVKSIKLDSIGGSVHAARGVARLVRENGLDAHVVGRCYSACTLVFIAGNRRTLGAQGRLGFHSYLAQLNTTSGRIGFGDAASEQAKDRQAFEARGVTSAFLAQMFDAPHTGIWEPKRAELLAAKVLTD